MLARLTEVLPRCRLGTCQNVDDRGVSRRGFIGHGLSVAGAMALAQVPLALAPRGLLASAQALEVDLARDTFNGLAAFVLPGNDTYSVAQGVTAPGPGAIGAGGVTPVLETLDRFVAASAIGADRVNVPISSAVAVLLNSFALQVNATASRGSFISPFARLSFAEKAKAMRLFDEDAVVGGVVQETRYLSGILITLVAAISFSEAPMLKDGKLVGTPVGWEICSYRGIANGHREFKGYFQGRRAVRG